MQRQFDDEDLFVGDVDSAFVTSRWSFRRCHWTPWKTSANTMTISGTLPHLRSYYLRLRLRSLRMLYLHHPPINELQSRCKAISRFPLCCCTADGYARAYHARLLQGIYKSWEPIVGPAILLALEKYQLHANGETATTTSAVTPQSMSCGATQYGAIPARNIYLWRGARRYVRLLCILNLVLLFRIPSIPATPCYLVQSMHYPSLALCSCHSSKMLVLLLRFQPHYPISFNGCIIVYSLFTLVIHQKSTLLPFRLHCSFWTRRNFYFVVENRAIAQNHPTLETLRT